MLLYLLVYFFIYMVNGLVVGRVVVDKALSTVIVEHTCTFLFQYCKG